MARSTLFCTLQKSSRSPYTRHGTPRRVKHGSRHAARRSFRFPCVAIVAAPLSHARHLRLQGHRKLVRDTPARTANTNVVCSPRSRLSTSTPVKSAPTTPISRSEAESASNTGTAPSRKRKQVVVVGGGWAGFGAAKALTEAGPYDVTLLDANPNPGGISAGWRTAGGRAVEAGIKGFWWSYPNIYDLVERELKIENPFTDWTRSSFFNPDGLQVEAPVLNRERAYPSPLGLFLHTRELFTTLPLADRASMIPLLYAIIDFERDEETYREYDMMTARELFRRFGISKRREECAECLGMLVNK